MGTLRTWGSIGIAILAVLGGLGSGRVAPAAAAETTTTQLRILGVSYSEDVTGASSEGKGERSITVTAGRQPEKIGDYLYLDSSPQSNMPVYGGAVALVDADLLVHTYTVFDPPIPYPHPCTYAASPSLGTQPIGVGFDFQADPQSSDRVKIRWNLYPAVVGSVPNSMSPCGGLLLTSDPLPPAAIVSSAKVADLLSGATTLTGAGTFHLNGSASMTQKVSISMTIAPVGDSDLSIDPAAATKEDQGSPSGRWLPKIPVSWTDKGCTSPAENSPNPRAYLIAGAHHGALATLLGAKEETLGGAAGFAGRALRLKKGIAVVMPTTNGANGVRWRQAVGKAHGDGTLEAGRGVFYGGRIACKLKSKPGKFTVASSAVFPLCHDQSTLRGGAWTGMKPEMRAALGRLWKVLEPIHACYAVSSGYRNQKTQDAAREHWHQIADKSKGDKRTAAEIRAALKQAGFAQYPTGYGKANKSGTRVAKGGPAIFSLHSLGIAADVHVEFSDTGSFDESLAKLRAAAAQAGLCGPPASDRVHVELPFIAGKDPKTGFPTVESLLPKNGKNPTCSSFSGSL